MAVGAEVRDVIESEVVNVVCKLVYFVFLVSKMGPRLRCGMGLGGGASLSTQKKYELGHSISNIS
jgi:hypothetical protein